MATTIAAVALLALVAPATSAAPPAPATPAAPAAAPAVAATDPAAYQPVGPLRMADTAQAECGCTAQGDGSVRVQLAGRDGAPAEMTAAVVTVTVAASTLPGYVSVWPAGGAAPTTSVLNLSVRGSVSNTAIVPVGVDGAIDVKVSQPVSLTVDLIGAFTTAETATAGRFQPLGPARLLDTRSGAALAAGGEVTVPLPAGVPADAVALAVNVVSIGAPAAGGLSAYPAGGSAPDSAFLAIDGWGPPRAAATIVPVSADGFTVRSASGGHVVVDVSGWFTGASADDTADGLFVAAVPQRLLDTRTDPPRLWPGGTREVAPPVGAAALVTNVTAVAPDSLGYVTAYPAGTAQPATSTLNTAHRNATTANLAITPITDRGSAYYSRTGTELVVDLQGWFTGAAGTATTPVPANTAPVPRVLMIGDSTLGGFVDMPRGKQSLKGFDYVLDAKPCRRLVRKSCVSSFTHVAPNTAQQAINASQGPFDIVIMKTGYNDGSSTAENDVRTIVAAARAKGAKLIIWMTFSESTVYGRYDAQNAVLRRLAASPEFPDLVVADWRGYAAASRGWYASDRLHLLGLGVWATGDYLSRWVAYASHLACPKPWTVGGAIDNPCPNPDGVHAFTGTYPDLKGLYGF